MTDEIEVLLGTLALSIALSVSPHPASSALNVPGEPYCFNNMMLNCFRAMLPEEQRDLLPDEDEYIIGLEGEWDHTETDVVCHFVNIHDLDNKWRVDMSFHLVVGVEDGDPVVIGVGGFVISETTRISDETPDKIAELMQLLNDAVLPADWPELESELFH